MLNGARLIAVIDSADSQFVRKAIAASTATRSGFTLQHLHRFTGAAIAQHDDLGQDAHRDLFRRFGVQLQPDRGVDAHEFFFGDAALAQFFQRRYDPITPM